MFCVVSFWKCASLQMQQHFRGMLNLQNVTVIEVNAVEQLFCYSKQLCSLHWLWLSLIETASYSLFVRVALHLQRFALGNRSRVFHRTLWGRFNIHFTRSPIGHNKQSIFYIAVTVSLQKALINPNSNIAYWLKIPFMKDFIVRGRVTF